MLEIEGLHAGYGDVRVLHDVTLRVDEGEIVSIVGANGAGKTTLIRAVMGTLPTTSGSVRFLGERLTGRQSHEIARLGLAQVMEGRRLFPHMTVEDNLLIGGDILRDTARQRRNLGWVYEMFPRLRERRTQLARSFSGGEQQMLAIARALMTGPKLLLLDEPSIGLAPVMVKEIFSRFPGINAEGVTILLVEQDVRRSLSLSRRGYVIEQGRVVLEGDRDFLLGNEEVKRAYLGV
ncbi:amino acid/amide ABC transporter ATP-binding protein 2, HAAT family [Tistlia consotensis]|uniref:Amino acid/amide ABC transporter ATP-binding protein 2, HAAT family n=1 Tax=Tistlia consotensis USBA 355 TaxID=560819 RepID=A0A1Y6B481_9PROT|nr:ABC transporter ATP-binding protein [Tistlia consotensis]SME91099.1 amino acid/amide ABC transporter ATP-binding protein 2, HAAT family [Tistlia consotensis USBA 355]SNR27114.1 amino acid/amide ABC transporter ATP-binding protein 2, HAAT family [Tistlia consotensis]